MIVCVVCVNFRDEILLNRGECKTQKILNFFEKLKNGKLSLQYRVQI